MSTYQDFLFTKDLVDFDLEVSKQAKTATDAIEKEESAKSTNALLASVVLGAAFGPIGAIAGGMVGPKIQKRLPEVFLKRLLALALIIVFLKYTGAIPFLR